jgi:hypothetical protein
MRWSEVTETCSGENKKLLNNKAAQMEAVVAVI